MKKEKGIHFYINIDNLNSIIMEEEEKTKKVSHVIHVLDAFFSSIEKYGKKLSKDLVVEKITGSRLHLYVIGEITYAYEIVKAISIYAYRLVEFVNKDIAKYKSIKDLNVSIGVAYGKFYEFEFCTKDYNELTTIGYAANYAAKLQALAKHNELSVSEDIYNSLLDIEKIDYKLNEDVSIRKYKQKCFYSIGLANIKSSVEIFEEDMRLVKEYVNGTNLCDIEFSGIRAPLNFQALSKTQCKEFEGIPVYVDVRDFTSQFDEDDSNLVEMANKTQEILETMYRISTSHGGIHIQFQGDRELSLYHNIPELKENELYQNEKKCFKNAVLASMRMIDSVKKYNVNVGVGEEFGRLFATKIGARGEKDNILLGETVIIADRMEDKNAGKNQIAITTKVYNGLKEEDSYLAEQFSKCGSYYIATIGYAQYMRNVSYKQQAKSNSRNDYNGAWRV
ncbi:adenylate/guanylate cyclase domain-containing protein [Eubacterium sp.]|uniref:adenylate/guanylate cyclase domain-containing protein n=1 Tax=Eubacterium sp. TaxID=142586 RepID=UPI0025F91D06|nr:adenylate/guanylate cyclase domain-containing protein [Eubacterium sp.]MCR5629591.1 hypothetical protein [Eubacterium sp.]